jgi:aryl-alcohol dehydrogenase-like predicted oxidoreductase
MSLSRRIFLESAAFASAYPLLAEKLDKKTGMPTRILGKTGARVSLIALGCGSRLLSYDDDGAQAALNRALDLGITYLDTAFGYGNGKSEERVGRAIKGRRKGLWLATKVTSRNYDEAMRTIDGSLKRLGTDHVDLLHIHNLQGAEDLAAAEAPNGVIKALYKAREQKLARFIGVTSHTDPRTLAQALERNDFDCTQMALNGALAGMRNGPSGMIVNEALRESFEHIALPVALKKKMGVIAMKVFAQDHLVGKAPIEKLLRYSLSLPVGAAVLGMPKLEFIDENVRLAKAFSPLSKPEMKNFSQELGIQYKAQLDAIFANHVDA